MMGSLGSGRGNCWSYFPTGHGRKKERSSGEFYHSLKPSGQRSSVSIPGSQRGPRQVRHGLLGPCPSWLYPWCLTCLTLVPDPSAHTTPLDKEHSSFWFKAQAQSKGGRFSLLAHPFTTEIKELVTLHPTSLHPYSVHTLSIPYTPEFHIGAPKFPTRSSVHQLAFQRLTEPDVPG